MIRKMRYFFLAVAIATFFIGSAQNTDSLSRVIRSSNENTVRIGLYAKISGVFLGQNSYDSAAKYLDEGIALAEKELQQNKVEGQAKTKIRSGR